MRIVSRSNSNVLNSRKTATARDLDTMFNSAPNLAAKTIRLFPQYSLSMLTEGLGEVYDVKTRQDNFTGINQMGYKWKLRGNNSIKVKFAQTLSGANIGLNKTVFTICLESDFYNPYDILRLEDHTQLFVVSGPEEVGPNEYEYSVKINSNNPSDVINTDYTTQGKETGYLYNAHPELSERGYMSSLRQGEDWINYLTRIRHSYSVSGDAASTKYLLEDVVNMKGKLVKNQYITDQLFMDAMAKFHFSKEMNMIYGRTSMDANGKCYLQDAKGRDIVTGDGIIESLSSSSKQTYTKLTINLLRDIISHMSLRMPKRTGNQILLTTGMEGYKEFQNLMDDLHAARFTNDDNYVMSKGGKLHLGAEYSSYSYMGNKIIVNCNNVFDHPEIPSGVDHMGRRLESFRMLFLDVSSYDGVKNIQMLAKDGRSFITGDLKGLGGMDGKTSGDISTSVDGSSKHILGHIGCVVHNPYSSFMLERAVL